MYWAAKQHCVAQSQRSVAGRFPRQQRRGREGQQQKQWRRGLRGYQRLILRVRLRLAAKSWKDTKQKTLRNKGLFVSCNNLIFFFSGEAWTWCPMVLCPGVYPKLMVVFAASGVLHTVFSSWNSSLCKWGGGDMHRGLGILKHGSSLTSWSLSISYCGTTGSTAVGRWSDCWSTQVAANAALRGTYSHCLPWSLQLLLPNKKVQI